MGLDKDKIKKSLTEQDIIHILKDLGSPHKKDTSGNLIFKTICHPNGKSFKLYYYKDGKYFRCYTDCGDTFDVFELVIRARRSKGYIISFPEAVKYISNLTGRVYTTNNIFNQNPNVIDDWDWIEKYSLPKKPDVILPEFNKNVLEVFSKKPHKVWINDNISIEAMERFRIGYYIGEDRITIPHYDINNRLVGIRGRSLVKEAIDSGKKYMPLMVESIIYKYPTMFNLYGINISKKAIKRFKKVIIFEGEKSCLQCYSYYGQDSFAVASMGSTISDFQRNMLLDLGVEEVFIAFDRQYEAYESEEMYAYAQKLLKVAKKFVPYVRTYILFDDQGLLDYKDSPSDKGKEILEKLMKCKYEVTTSDYE